MESKLIINNIQDVDLFKDIYAACYFKSTPYDHNMFDSQGIYQSVSHFIERKIAEIHNKYCAYFQPLYSNLAIEQYVKHNQLVRRSLRYSFKDLSLSLAQLIVDESMKYIIIYCTLEQLAGQKILFFYSDSPYYSKRLWNKFCKTNNLNIKFFDDHMKLANDLLTIKPFILDNVNNTKAIKYLRPEQQNNEFMQMLVNEYLLERL